MYKICTRVSWICVWVVLERFQNRGPSKSIDCYVCVSSCGQSRRPNFVTEYYYYYFIYVQVWVYNIMEVQSTAVRTYTRVHCIKYNNICYYYTSQVRSPSSWRVHDNVEEGKNSMSSYRRRYTWHVFYVFSSLKYIVYLYTRALLNYPHATMIYNTHRTSGRANK